MFKSKLALKTFSGWVVLAFLSLSCSTSYDLNQNHLSSLPRLTTPSKSLDTFFRRSPVSNFKVQEFISFPDSGSRPKLLNNTVGTLVGETYWLFEMALPVGKTTTIYTSITGTEACQSGFFSSPGFPIAVPTGVSTPALYTYGVGPNDLATTKDGAYSLTLRDETGATYSYTVHVNNGIPPICPTPTPEPTPMPTNSPNPGGGQGNGGDNGGCESSGFSILKAPSSKNCDSLNPKINKQPVELRNRDFCRTPVTGGISDPDFELLNVYDFDKGAGRSDKVFVFIKGGLNTSTAPVNFAHTLGSSAEVNAFSRVNGLNADFSDNLALMEMCRGNDCLNKMSFDQVGGHYPLNSQLGSFEPLSIIKNDLAKSKPKHVLDDKDLGIFALAVDFDRAGNVRNNLETRINGSTQQTVGLRFTLDRNNAQSSSLQVKVGLDKGKWFVDCNTAGQNF